MKKRQFLKLPEFPGGKTEFQQYVAEHLKYPKEALQHQIEGIVHLEAVVDDNGRVSGAQVIKGIGYGCDEEAVRLINEARFGSVNNKGLRVKSTQKFKVEFSLRNVPLPAQTGMQIPDFGNVDTQVVYTVVPSKKDDRRSSGTTIGYTIDL